MESHPLPPDALRHTVCNLSQPSYTTRSIVHLPTAQHPMPASLTRCFLQAPSPSAPTPLRALHTYIPTYRVPVGHPKPVDSGLWSAPRSPRHEQRPETHPPPGAAVDARPVLPARLARRSGPAVGLSSSLLVPLTPVLCPVSSPHPAPSPTPTLADAAAVPACQYTPCSRPPAASPRSRAASPTGPTRCAGRSSLSPTARLGQEQGGPYPEPELNIKHFSCGFGILEPIPPRSWSVSDSAPARFRYP